jgi:hypothetical protein
MNMEQLEEGELAVETKIPKENPLQCHSVHHSGKPLINHLSCGMFHCHGVTLIALSIIITAYGILANTGQREEY